MTYQTAKQLKEAGFPQKVVCTHGEDALCECGEIFEAGNQQEVYVPQLIDLIEACGDKFGHLNLSKAPSPWLAFSSDEVTYRAGTTPEEAMALLWMALNEK